MATGADERPVVLITGATSGIGKASAELLAGKGYRVFGTGRRPQGGGAGYELLPLEVTSDESAAECVRTVTGRAGRLDVLVNNVGTGVLGAAEEVSVEEAKRLFDVNFFGAVRMTNAALPHLRGQRSGRVLFLSSSGGLAGVPFAAFYVATKFALEGYAESLRYELRPFGVHVSVVAPGPVSTPAGDTAARAARTIPDYAAARDRLTAEFVKAIRNGMPPARAARGVWRAVRDDPPKPRYAVGTSSWGVSLARRVLPDRAFQSLVRLGLRLR